MPKNLAQKIALVLEDAESLSRPEVIRLFERLITEELQFAEAEHAFDTYDLNLIRSRAINKFNDMALNSEALGKIKGNSEGIRMKCLVESTIEMLRGKSLINFTMKFNGKK